MTRPQGWPLHGSIEDYKNTKAPVTRQRHGDTDTGREEEEDEEQAQGEEEKERDDICGGKRSEDEKKQHWDPY